MKRSEVVGQNIKIARLKNGLTTKGLSEVTGIPESSLINYETGYRTPRDATKIKLAQALKTPVEDLFFFDQYKGIE